LHPDGRAHARKTASAASAGAAGAAAGTEPRAFGVAAVVRAAAGDASAAAAARAAAAAAFALASRGLVEADRTAEEPEAVIEAGDELGVRRLEREGSRKEKVRACPHAVSVSLSLALCVCCRLLLFPRGHVRV
jgi:hypothetical protein